MTNSYGQVLLRYIDKVFAMGFGGIWHDDYAEFGGSGGGFTFDSHDGRIAFLHPRNLSIQYKAASLALLTLPLEMRIKQLVEQHHGFMTCNGAPLTRTVILRRFGQHTAENAAQQVCKSASMCSYTHQSCCQGREDSAPSLIPSTFEMRHRSMGRVH